MVLVNKLGVLLEKSAHGFESEGVMNPAAIQKDGQVYIFYRAVGNGNYSSIGLCRLSGPMEIAERLDAPVLFPQFDYESQGMEDPRIVQIEGLYYLTYTAFDGVNALGALATSPDLQVWEKQGILAPQISFPEFCRLAEAKGLVNEKYLRYNEREHVLEMQGKKTVIWDKNIIFFPRRINGKLFFLHRVRPDIQIASINSLEELTSAFWQNYFIHLDEGILLTARFEHEVSYIGGGCPPIETEHGWVVIYHAVHDTVLGYVYSACAALLDLENPHVELSRLPQPLFAPEYPWELKGEVNNVCFPTGAIVEADTLYIYYGAADEQIACASLSLSALVQELIIEKKKQSS